MNVNNIIRDSRVAHVRELKAEISRLKAENAALRNANEELASHFALALQAARDFERLAPEGTMLAIDGWNVVFNSRFKPISPTAEARRLAREKLIDFVRSLAKARTQDFLWLVFDGPGDNSRVEGNLRVSYTGGEGEHRADRLITDYAHFVRLNGRPEKMTLVTNDKDFCAALKRLGVCSINTWSFTNAQ